MNKTILILGGLGLAAFALAAKKESSTNGGGTSPIVPGDHTGIDPNSGAMQVVSGPSEMMEGEFAGWRKQDWIEYARNLADNNDFGDALEQLWISWKSEENAYKGYFPNIETLIFYLGMPDPPKDRVSGVGSFTIEYNSTPIYDTFTNDWNGVDAWQCAHWKLWHEKLETHYGLITANQRWTNAWNHPDNNCWVIGMFGCPDTSYCRYHCDFVEYFDSKGIKIGNMVSNASCDVATTVTNVTSTAKSTAQFLSYAVPIGLGLWVGVELYNYVKNKT